MKKLFFSKKPTTKKKGTKLGNKKRLRNELFLISFSIANTTLTLQSVIKGDSKILDRPPAAALFVISDQKPQRQWQGGSIYDVYRSVWFYFGQPKIYKNQTREKERENQIIGQTRNSSTEKRFLIVSPPIRYTFSSVTRFRRT